MQVSIDNFYWLFSAAAQSISAFVAFLLTGYALVYAIMDGLQQSDSSLAEVHHELKRRYHWQLALLCFFTAAAVVLSLLCVYLNPYDFDYKKTLFAAAAAIDIGVIVGGVLFVIAIINPDKYQQAAKRLLREEQRRIAPRGKAVSVGEFMTVFISLEKAIRDFTTRRQLPAVTDRPRGGGMSFPDMVNTLYRNELIDRSFVAELMEIAKYRNLVVHGRVDDVDESMVARVRHAKKRWDTAEMPNKASETNSEVARSADSSAPQG
jgi:hypothetical protein